MSSKEGRLRVLHVEDEEVDQMALARMVKEMGLPYDIDRAASLAEASEKLEKNSYDIVLLDYLLPDGTGIEMLDRTRGIPSIFITGSGDETVAVKAIKGGACDYLVKASDIGYLALLPVVIDKALQASQLAEQQKEAEQQIVRQNAALKKINSELSALYKASSAISQSIDLKGLLNEVLDTVTGIELLRVERKGAIFIVEGERMKLVAGIGQSDPFLNAHEGMKVGECLCGRVAETGEPILIKNSLQDVRHTITYAGMTPAGQIILPLKAADRVVGVLCLYLPVDAEVDEETMKLLRAIAGQLGMAISNAMLYEETKSRSLHDPLTGLANRRLMGIELGRNMARARRDGSPFSVVMMDIDHFKKYNDTYGHPAGDALLADFSRVVLKEIREVDNLFRYGGEEFVLLLPDTGLQGASTVAERIRARVEEKTAVTISLGVSSYRVGMKKEEEAIREADEAMYQAKQTGRNRVDIWV